jgi:putative endonuclease
LPLAHKQKSSKGFPLSPSPVAEALAKATSAFYNSPYTGFTENLRERSKRHINGHAPATQNRPPVELIFYCAFQNKYKAFNFEKYLKSGSGRAFMNKRLI